MRVIAAVTGVAVIAALSLGGPLRRLELVFFVALPLGLALAEMGRDQWMTPIRLRRTVCTKIRETPEGVAAIRGRIVPGECGLVISPVTGRAAVWVGLDFMEHHFGRGGPSEWVIRREAAGNDFLIDDGSGELAHVALSGARVLGDEILGCKHEWSNDRLRAHLDARGLQGLLAEGGRWVVERMLLPGSEVIVRRPATRRAPPANGHASPASSLFFEAGAGREEPLLLSPWPLSPLGPPPGPLLLGLVCAIGSFAPLAVTIWWRLGLAR